jgi:hypothetical protein
MTRRYARLAGAFFLFAATAEAHVISMSTGFATVTGNRVEYILRMPAYEITQLKDPAQNLLNHIRFTSGFETGRRLDGECHYDATAATLICAANYRFERPIVKLGVECTFYEVTVPNHIHMLHADQAGKFDQAILDDAFPSATLAFRPPTPAEIAVDQSASGAMHVWTNLTQVLLLIALALAARAWRELAALLVAFLAGELASTVILLRTAWVPPPRFAEAAAALALAYLSLEILAFPKSGGRWLLALLFGAFQGMFFALFVSESGYRTAWVMTGAAFGALIIGGVCALAGLVLFGAVARYTYRNTLRRLASCGLLATGLVWFTVRLRS